MKLLIQCLAVGAAGFLGAMARFLVGLACGRAFSRFPVGTMVINLSGSFFLGWFVTVATTRLVISAPLQLAIATGFVGAYTTFSTFMLESNALMDDGAWIKAGVNLVGSVILGLLAVRLGIYLAR